MEVHGFDGNIAFGTGLAIGAAVTGWSGELAIDEDVIPPAFGSKMKKTKLGAGSFKGTFRGNLTKDVAGSQPFDNASVGTGAVNWNNMYGTITLTAASGCTIVCTAAVTNIRINRNNGEHGTIEGTFANSEDDLVVSWDET